MLLADDWALSSWRAVVSRIPDPHPFVAPGWQRAWWECFGTGELAVLPLGDEGDVAGVAALCGERGGAMRFLGSREVTDYPGPAIVPGRERESAAALVEQMCERGWPVLEIENARPEDGFAAALERAARAAGLRVTAGPDEPIAVLGLPSGWPAYLRRLGRHARHEVERKRRGLASARLRTADARTLEGDLDGFFALFRRAAGDKGRFATPAIERFMRRIARLALEDGTLRLDVLELDGAPLAIALGFQGPRAYYLYNMAHDPDARPLSPGIVLVAATIERAIAHGLERYDFMRGLERYKLEFGATPSDLQRLRLARH
jgi:CelD/BcsL family acetyltransferase involved in cellulose biosynthesis